MAEQYQKKIYCQGKYIFFSKFYGFMPYNDEQQPKQQEKKHDSIEGLGNSRIVDPGSACCRRRYRPGGCHGVTIQLSVSKALLLFVSAAAVWVPDCRPFTLKTWLRIIAGKYARHIGKSKRASAPISQLNRPILNDRDLADAVRDYPEWLSTLESLNLAGTEVTDLSPLAGMNCLECLSIEGTPVRDISVLYTLPALAMLDLNYAILQAPKQWGILDELDWLKCVNREEWKRSLPGRDGNETLRLRRGISMLHV
jgi:hypothetical protein